MRTEKKLKRGLPELSRFFSVPGAALTAADTGERPTHVLAPMRAMGGPERRPLAVALPEDTTETGGAPPNLVCASFLPIGVRFQLQDQIRLLEVLEGGFHTSHLLSSVPDSKDPSWSVGPFPGRNGQTTLPGPDRFRCLDQKIILGYVSRAWFRQMMELKPCQGRSRAITGKKSLVLFDSQFLEWEHDPVFSLLDHCIFVAPPQGEQLIRVYQLMKACLDRRRSHLFSLLLVGPRASTLWEFAYERFYEIVSHFLGCDLGFLGWAEAGEYHLNPELLQEEAGSSAHSLAKSCLRKALLECSEVG